MRGVARTPQDMQGKLRWHGQSITKYPRKVGAAWLGHIICKESYEGVHRIKIGAWAGHHKVCKESCGRLARTSQSMQGKMRGRSQDSKNYARNQGAGAGPGHHRICKGKYGGVARTSPNMQGIKLRVLGQDTNKYTRQSCGGVARTPQIMQGIKLWGTRQGHRQICKESCGGVAGTPRNMRGVAGTPLDMQVKLRWHGQDITKYASKVTGAWKETTKHERRRQTPQTVQKKLRWRGRDTTTSNMQEKLRGTWPRHRKICKETWLGGAEHHKI